MQNLHFKLTSKYPKYNNWHQTKHHNKIHWGVLVGWTLVVFYLLQSPLLVIAADTVAPTTPTNLTATAISSSQINLSWTASTDDVGVTGYKIYRCAGSACAPTVQIATSPTNSYSDTGLTASTAYTYAVSAYDAAGNNSPQSTSIITTTLSQIQTSVFDAIPDNTWVNLNPTQTPGDRSSWVKAKYDSTNDKLFIFGASAIGDYQPYNNDVWHYDPVQNIWEVKYIGDGGNAEPADFPGTGHPYGGIAYDSKRSQIIMYGIYNRLSGDLRTWSHNVGNNIWTKLIDPGTHSIYELPQFPETQPRLVGEQVMEYDEANDVVVYFGGLDGSVSCSNQTWLYIPAQNKWELKYASDSSTSLPPKRCGASMAYDSKRQRMYMIGGNSGDTALWTYDAVSSTWQNVNASNPPPARSWPGLAYDTKNDALLLFGGWGGKNDLWVYEPGTNAWTQLNPSPAPAMSDDGDTLEYDAKRNVFFLWSGKGKETWAYRYKNIQTVPGTPTAMFSAIPSQGDAPLNVSFDASQSTDSDGTIISYSWNFGDGTNGTGKTVTHSYSSAGNYSVTLTITDNDNETAQSSQVINVTTPISQGTKFINFQPSSAQIHNGYQKDDGSLYNITRRYGWNIDLVANTRDREVNTDQRLDTFVFSSNIATWNYDISNGSYSISLASGDPSYDQGPQRVEIEGKIAINDVTTKANNYTTLSDYQVTVSDNKLTLKIGGAGGNTMLNYLIIKPLASIDDPIAPQAITNLAVSFCAINSCVLVWTASGDDGAVGTASSYDIRYSTSNITEANWENATQVTGEPNPQVSGSSESFVVNGLTHDTAYYFAIKALDEASNISGLSNIANANTKTPVPVGSLNIPLTIQEALPQGVLGINRNSEPVTVGIPLKDSDNITDVSQLGLSGADKGQFRVLARWPSGNIKWVLADFQASVNANGSNTDIALTKGQGNFGGTDLAVDNSQNIVVNTGAAEFTIKKSNFNIFDKVAVNGQTIVNPGNNGRLVVRDQNNREFSSVNDGSSTSKIEENGPVKTVIKAQGALKDSLGNRLIDYTLRMHFYQGKSYVTADVTLRNASESNVNPINFKSAELIVPLVLGGTTRTFEFARKNDTVTGSLADSETAYLYQAFSKDKMGGDTWRWDTAPLEKFGPGTFDYVQQGLEIKHNGNVLNALGSRDDWTQGWGEFKNSSGQGLTIALRWMSAMWPTGFELSGNGDAKVELFSKYNSKSNLKFAWGAHETREVIFDFHTQSANNQNVLYNLQYPLAARADYTHYRDTGAIYGEKQLATKDEHLQWFQGKGTSFFTPPDLSNPPMEVYRFYYFREGGGFNQIDFPLAYLLNFLRTGNAGYYTLGEQISRYNSDNAVMHSDGFDLSLTKIDPEVVNYGSMNGGIYDIEHAHWLGLPIAYYLTGNEAIKEAILDYGEKMIRETGSTPGMWLMRVWARFYRSYAIMFEFTKDERYRKIYEHMTDKVLNSRDTNSQNNLPYLKPYGWNLERGYMWLPHANCYGDLNDIFCQKRLLSDFILTLLYSESVYQVARVMQDNNIPYRVEELEDHLFGIAQFVYNEMYLTRNGGTAYRDFGYLYDYALDETNVASVSLRPEDTSRLMTFAYEKTGDTKYLDVGGKLLWGTTNYASDLTPSEMQGQSFIFTDLRRDKAGWKTVSGVNAQNNGSGSYTLSWAVPQNTAGYQIKYSDKPIVDWLGFNQVTRIYQYDPTQYTAFFAANNISNEPTPSAPGTQQQFTVTGLDPNKTWYFTAWYEKNGASGTPSDTESPSLPTNLQAQVISSSQINLSWTASTDNVGVAGYKIYRCADSACSPTTQIATSATNSYSDTGLSANTTYTYVVSAYDVAGNESAKSQSISVTTFSQFKQADFNKDGLVNQLDFDILKQEWNRTDRPVSDLNQDGVVDSRDLGIMMSEWTR